MNRRMLFLLSAICCSLGLGASAPGSLSMGTRAVTQPSADVTLSFVLPGRIQEIRFKNGDQVKAGELVIRLDDRADA